jgi:endonuclease/exonuclease/phosphatase family metal-dependent hydrolase
MKLTFLAMTVVLLTGCAARAPVKIELLNEPPCKLASGIAWAGPIATEHRSHLSDWCRSVGSVLVQSPSFLPMTDVGKSGLVLLTWNKHEDYGDLEMLLRSFVGKWPVVALIQEVARTDESVPIDAPATVHVPGEIGPKQRSNRDIATIATDFNMSLAYLPSIPNGSRTKADRGCAILSTLPMSDVVGIELPWVSQRRVAVMATLMAMKNGKPWRLRILSVHLDNRPGRSEQAAAIADFLKRQPSSDLPLVIGGDLNSWFGIHDEAVRELERAAPRVQECGDRATFQLGLRLDHVFTTLPSQARVGCVVEDDRFGSDHYPIVLRLFR